jgi:hypothetical protein
MTSKGMAFAGNSNGAGAAIIEKKKNVVGSFLFSFDLVNKPKHKSRVGGRRMPLDWNVNGPPPPPGGPPPQCVVPPQGFPPAASAAAFVPRSGLGVGAGGGSLRGVSKTAAPFLPGTATTSTLLAPLAPHTTSVHGVPQAQTEPRSTSASAGVRCTDRELKALSQSPKKQTPHIHSD